MTSSIKSRLPGQTPAKGPQRAHREDPEERFARRVTLLFIGLIAAVVAIVVIAFVYDYYVGHLKPVATVGGTSITRDQWTDRAKLEYQRLVEQEQSIREQISAGTLSVDEGNARLQEISTAKGNVASQLHREPHRPGLQGPARAEGRPVRVDDEDVNEAIMEEASTPRRATSRSSRSSRRPPAPRPPRRTGSVRYGAVQDAKAALDNGDAFADVAKLYSTDATKDKGGEYGFISADSTHRPGVRGHDLPDREGPDHAGHQGRGRRLAHRSRERGPRRHHGQRLRAGDARHRRLGPVHRPGAQGGARPEARGHRSSRTRPARMSSRRTWRRSCSRRTRSRRPPRTRATIRASHILYSPNDDPSGAQTLDAADPAWAAAEAEAQKAADQLHKVTDPELRAKAFATRAKSQSDDTGSGANGGDLGYFARDTMVPEFADPLFDDKNLVAGDIVGPGQERLRLARHPVHGPDARRPGAPRRGQGQAEPWTVPTSPRSPASCPTVRRRPIGGDLGWLAQSQLDDGRLDRDDRARVRARGPRRPSPRTTATTSTSSSRRPRGRSTCSRRPSSGPPPSTTGTSPRRSTASTDGTITRDGDLFSNTPQVGG